MKAFQGRYYKDVAGNVPSDDLQRQDLGPAQVLQEPAQRGGDSWTLIEEDGKRFLVRKHVLPRLPQFKTLPEEKLQQSRTQWTSNAISKTDGLEKPDSNFFHNLDLHQNGCEFLHQKARNAKQRTKSLMKMRTMNTLVILEMNLRADLPIPAPHSLMP